MKHVLAVMLIVALVAAAPSTSQAQDLKSTIEKLSMDAAKAYVDPLVSALGSNLNGGWFHRAPMGKILGIDLELGVVFMATTFKDENKQFDFTGQFQFSYDEAYKLAQQSFPAGNAVVWNQLALRLSGQEFNLRVYGPTIVGSKDEFLTIDLPQTTYSNVIVPGDSYVIPGQQYVIQDANGDKINGLLEGLKAMPLFAPQLSIGTLFGTQATFRYLPEAKLDDKIGKAKYFGFGVQHNPEVWLGSFLPVDLALAYYTQDLKVGDLPLFEAKTTAYGINVSKRLGWGFLNLTPYAGFMLETSKLTFKYQFDAVFAGSRVPQDITFELEGSNKSRIVVGASLKLLFINVNADYNIGKYNSFTLGAMLII